MSRLHPAALLIACLFLANAGRPAASQDDRVRELVARLGSEGIEDRAEAVRKLKEIGPAALPELEKAAAGSDSEIASRAKILIRTIGLCRRLSPAFRKALPGIEDRLAQEGDAAWLETFLHATKRDEKGRPLVPDLSRGDLETLAGPAAAALSTPAEHIDYCQTAALWRLTSAAPVVLRDLEQKNDTLRILSAVAAVQIDAREAIPRLSPLLGSANSEVRGAAAWALEKFGAREEIPRICSFFQDGDPLIRLDAATAAGRLAGRTGSSASLPGLQALLKDEVPYVRSGAVEALARLGARGELLELLSHQDPVLREAAAVQLGRSRVQEAVPGLRKLLSDPEPPVRAATLDALGQLPAAGAAAEAAKLLADPTPAVSRAALRFLKTPDQVPTLRDFWGRAPVELRPLLLYALLTLDAAPPVPELLKLLKDRDEQVARLAVGALGNLRAGEALPALRELMSHPELGSDAVLALGQMKDKESLPAILRKLDEKTADGEGPRWTTIRALGELGSTEAVPALKKLARGSDPYNREVAVEVLISLGLTEQDPDIQKLLRSAEEPLRLSTARGLCAAGCRAGVEILIENGTELSDLNRVRRPDVWKKLLNQRVDRVLTGTQEDLVAGSIEAAGLRAEGLAALGLAAPAYVLKGQHLIQRGEAMALWQLRGIERFNCGFILETDRVRILPEWEAREFWKAWWAEERGRDR